MNDTNGNSLKKNLDDWAIFSIINNTKVNQHKVIGWKIVAGKKVTAEALIYIIRKFKGEIVIRAKSEKDKLELGNLATGADKINFYLPNDTVLFQTEIKQLETNGDLRVKIPKMIAQVERRKYMRLLVDERSDVQVTFLKDSSDGRNLSHNFSKNCFDISAGGISFYVSRSELKYFKLGDDVPNIELTFGSNSLSVSGKVVNIMEVEPNSRNDLHYKVWKICLKLTNISSQDREEIDQFVFNNLPMDNVI